MVEMSGVGPSMIPGSSSFELSKPRLHSGKTQIQWKTLFVLYTSLSLFRFLLALVITEPIVIPDELAYKSMALGFFKWRNFFALNPEMVGAPTNIGYIFYPFVISPIFIFDGLFLIAGKLLNSLLINTAIFPLFGILKDFVPQRSAALSAALSLSLPSFGFASLLMAENAAIPLTALFLFTLYKAFSEGSRRYSALSAVVLSLLALTKPHTLSLFLTVIGGGGFLSLYFMTAGKDKKKGQKIILSIGIFVSVIFLGLAVFFLGSKQSSLQTLGFYLAIVKNIPSEIIKILGTEAFDFMQFLQMTAIHLGGFLIPMLLPFMVTIWAWLDALQKKRVKSLVILSLGLFIFVKLLVLVLLISIFYAPIQSFSRLHGRFYSIIFFFFIVSFAAFGKTLEWTRARKASLVTLTVLAALALLPGFQYFKSPERFVLPLDYPELNWLAFLPPAIIVLMIAGFFLVTIQVVRGNSSQSYWIYFIVWAFLANLSVTQTLLNSYQPQRLLTRPARTFISETVKDPDSGVAVFDRGELYGNMTVFWLPYRFTKAKFNTEDSVLRGEDIPEETDYAILFGEFSLDFVPTGEWREGKCTILFLGDNDDAQESFELDLSSQWARIWRRVKSQIPAAK